MHFPRNIRFNQGCGGRRHRGHSTKVVEANIRFNHGCVRLEGDRYFPRNIRYVCLAVLGSTLGIKVTSPMQQTLALMVNDQNDFVVYFAR